MNSEWPSCHPIVDYVLYYNNSKMIVTCRENGRIANGMDGCRVFKDDFGNPLTFKSLNEAEIFLNLKFKRENISSKHVLQYQDIMKGLML